MSEEEHVHGIPCGRDDDPVAATRRQPVSSNNAVYRSR